MAERYRRYALNVPANTETTIFTAPDDGLSPAGAADSVIIGFFVAATTSTAGTLTVSLTNYYDATVVKLADTIPLPADTSVDLMPGKMVLQHALNNAGTPALTGDIIKVTATQPVSVILSMVERI
jgi:hypothetical protein